MTRKEQIKEVAGAYAIDEVKDTCNPASKRGLLYAGFVDGAEWADRTMIDKACEWLEEHHVPSAFGDMSKVKDFVEQFRKAMKGEEDEDHFIDANKKVDRVIGTADHIKTALDVLNTKGGEK